ncbi:hypothetical protein PZB77_29795 [Streptomyces sp. AM 2-1-1]|nr:hypothetical protein [Streptomyces sp. AM 2-1-1]WEH43350.1 hypothetical protein PZB77_29795 [Streptomyces sp. AM 2-1-1]
MSGEDEVEDQGDGFGGGEWVVVRGGQCGEEVVAGVGAEVVHDRVCRGAHGVEGFAQGATGAAVGEHRAPERPVRALRFGDADELTDDGDRQRVGEAGDQIDAVRAGVGGGGVEEGVGDVFDAGTQPGHAAGRERPDHRAAQAMVCGSVGAEQSGAQVLHLLGASPTGAPQLLDAMLGFTAGHMRGVVHEPRIRQHLAHFFFPPGPPKGGRPPEHGAEFVFGDPATWGTEQAVTTTDTRLHEKAAAQAWARPHPRLTRRAAWLDHDGPLPLIKGTVIRLIVEKLPSGGVNKPVWLWWSGTGATSDDVNRCWQSFLRRFDIEHTFRLFKQTLERTQPCLRSSEAADRWTWLRIAAQPRREQSHCHRRRVQPTRPPQSRHTPRRVTPVPS